MQLKRFQPSTTENSFILAHKNSWWLGQSKLETFPNEVDAPFVGLLFSESADLLCQQTLINVEKKNNNTFKMLVKWVNNANRGPNCSLDASKTPRFSTSCQKNCDLCLAQRIIAISGCRDERKSFRIARQMAAFLAAEKKRKAFKLSSVTGKEWLFLYKKK